ncbi:hypothetical protein EPN81_01035 [Patescibacteria group bacterium]|nr:MAG: hypothetical protein EPN81_01035 [Patescibacteria group bacterium]
MPNQQNIPPLASGGNNWFQTLLDKINQLAEQFELNDSQTNTFRDFVVTTARTQYQVGSKSGAGWAFKKAREEQSGIIGQPQPATNSL